MRTFWLRCALFISVALLQSLNPAALAQQSNLSRDWVSTSWDVWCPRANDTGAVPCEGQETAAAVFQGYLESSSQWYESLGFLGPKVVTQFGRYQAQIVRAENAIEDGEPYSGLYDPNNYWIYLNEDNFFALGEPGETFEAAEFRVQQSYIYTSVHEVFHAIQETYTSFACGEGRGWICEGMADAALRAYADKFESEMNIAMERRFYHEPLHQPGQEEWGYGTWQFWLDVGGHLNSKDKISYFQDIMQRGLAPHKGLTGVDRALKDLLVGPESPFWEESGLYDLLPWFFAKHDPDNIFPQPLRRSVRLEPGQASVEERITNIVVQPVAGRSVELTIDKPADIAVGVKISFARPNEDLHLIVDNVRYDKNEGESRNVFFAVTSEEPELKLDVVIANVAKAAQTTRENNVDLVVELMTPFASVVVSGTSGGSQYVVPPDRVGASVVGHMPESNICNLLVQLPSEDGDLIWLSGRLSAPLSAGRHPQVGKTETGIDIWGANVMLGCDKGPCSSYGHPYSDRLPYRGWVEISHINDTHVAGGFDLAARGDKPLRVAGTFLAPLSGILGVVGQKPRGLGSDHPCAPSLLAGAPGGLGQSSGSQETQGAAEGSTEGDDSFAGDSDSSAGDGDDSSAGPEGPGTFGEAAAATAVGGRDAEDGDGDRREGAPSSSEGLGGGVDAVQGSGWLLEFLEERQSVLWSDPQVVEGSGAGTVVSLVSNSFDLTVAVPLFGCTVEPSGESALDRLEHLLAYQRWQESGRPERGLILFDYSGADLRLDSAQGGVFLQLESGEGTVTLRPEEIHHGETEGSPLTGKQSLTDLILEVRRGQDTFRCLEPMSMSFAISPLDEG